MNELAYPPLRPLRLVELLDRGFYLYRSNFVKITAIVAIPMIPTIALSALPFGLAVPFFFLGQSPTWNPDGLAPLGFLAFMGALALAFLVSVIGGLLLQSITPAAVAQAIADIYIDEPTGIIGTFRKIKKHWLKLLGAVGLPLLFYTGLSTALSTMTMFVPCLQILFMPIQYSIMVIFQALTMPLIPAVVIFEQQSVGYSIRRAWELARQRFWWILGLMASLYALNLAFIIGPAGLAFAILHFITQFVEIGNPALLPVIGSVLTLLAIVLLQVVYISFQWVTVTLMYFDLRVRLEGLDLSLQAAEISHLLAILAQVPPLEKTPLITGFLRK